MRRRQSSSLRGALRSDAARPRRDGTTRSTSSVATWPSGRCQECGARTRCCWCGWCCGATRARHARAGWQQQQASQQAPHLARQALQLAQQEPQAPQEPQAQQQARQQAAQGFGYLAGTSRVWSSTLRRRKAGWVWVQHRPQLYMQNTCNVQYNVHWHVGGHERIAGPEGYSTIPYRPNIRDPAPQSHGSLHQAEAETPHEDLPAQVMTGAGHEVVRQAQLADNLRDRHRRQLHVLWLQSCGCKNSIDTFFSLLFRATLTPLTRGRRSDLS